MLFVGLLSVFFMQLFVQRLVFILIKIDYKITCIYYVFFSHNHFLL